MGNFGIKVAVTGKDVSSTDIRDLMVHSQKSMLKFHSSSLGTITMDSGDTNKYVDISHSLGYVPAYLGFVQYDSNIYMINSLWSPTNSVYAWADTSKVRCGWGFYSGAYNQNTYSNSMQDCFDESSGSRIGYQVGKNAGASLNGALWFPSVPVPKNATIVSATLSYVVGYRWGSNQDIQFDTWGIDEDNTADFSSYPMNRPQTTATTYFKANINNSRFDVNVASIIQEITTRSGWAAGNNIGFQVRVNGSSPDNVAWEDDIGVGADSYLTIVYQSGSSKTLVFRVIVFKDKIA